MKWVTFVKKKEGGGGGLIFCEQFGLPSIVPSWRTWK